jgi:hypothetical protein
LLAARKKKVASKKKSSRLVYKPGENAGANMPHSVPIAGESEEKYVSDAIPKEDGEKRPTPNPGIYSGGSGWLNAMLAGKTAMGVPPGAAEGSPSVPVKNSQPSPAIRGSDSPRVNESKTAL